MISMTREEKQHYDELMASGDIEALREYLRILEEIQKTTKRLMQASGEDRFPTMSKEAERVAKEISDSILGCMDRIIKENCEDA